MQLTPQGVMKLVTDCNFKDANALLLQKRFEQLSCDPDEDIGHSTMSYVQQYLAREWQIHIKSTNTLHAVFRLFPQEAFEISNKDIARSGLDSGEVEAVLNAVSGFYLGCPWPINRDKIDIVHFIQTLSDAITLFGDYSKY